MKVTLVVNKHVNVQALLHETAGFPYVASLTWKVCAVYLRQGLDAM